MGHQRMRQRAKLCRTDCLSTVRWDQHKRESGLSVCRHPLNACPEKTGSTCKQIEPFVNVDVEVFE
jgi:hypothetical protein